MQSEPIIGIDANRSYRAQATGTERYSRRIIEHLLQIERPGIRFRLYFNDPPPQDAPLTNAESRILPARKFWTHRRLSTEMWQDPADLLFVPSHVLPLIHPNRSVVTVHDLGYLYEADSYTASTRLQLKLTTRWNAHRASHLIAISEATRRDLERQCGVTSRRITVVHHGIDEQFQPVSKAEVDSFRRRMRLPERFVLCLSTIQPRKNLERLISAFERVSAGDESIHLIMAGKIGWLSEPITNRVHQSPYRDRIRLLGHLPDPQLPLLYNAATGFALPSLYEGFGLPVLEAMACGVPTLLSNRGALPELAGADAVVIDPLDIDAIATGIIQILDRRRWQEGIQKRIAHARQFRWADAARQTLDVLRETLGTPREGDQ
jgi:glycosyltransferase involved in cell wall biosynthesis